MKEGDMRRDGIVDLGKDNETGIYSNSSFKNDNVGSKLVGI